MKTLEDIFEEKNNSIWHRFTEFIKYGIYYNIKYKIQNLRYMLEINFNRCHLATLSAVFSGYSNTDEYIYSVTRLQLKELLRNMQKKKYATAETYDSMCKWIALAIRMLDITLGDVDCFHYTGDMKFIQDSEDITTVNMDDIVYHCDVNVNTKNIRRFVNNDDIVKFYTERPHELYVLKAKYLFHKIMFKYSDSWWD